MASLLTRPPSGADPPTPALEGTALYTCDCRGFTQNDMRYFCLRCLDNWVAGLAGVFSGKRLEREMRKAASVLARRLKEDPHLGRLLLNDALNAAESFPRRN